MEEEDKDFNKHLIKFASTFTGAFHERKEVVFAEIAEMPEKLMKAFNERRDIIFSEIGDIKYDATLRYGTQNHNLGSKGLFVELDRKNQRLKRFLWDEKRTTSENLKNTLQDLVIYGVLTIMQAELEGLIDE